MSDIDALRFPVGPFRPRVGLTLREREELIGEIAHFPSDLRFVVSTLSAEQLDTPYREGGWTVRQVVHHVPDSHMQGYVRFKLAMTEEQPNIKTYEQQAWGETEESRNAPVEISLNLLDALHKRWVLFLMNLGEEDFARTYRHPELGELTLETTLQLYVWHGRHHLGHVNLVAGRNEM
jgi:uncharacterized damage-inducible protein DinB